MTEVIFFSGKLIFVFHLTFSQKFSEVLSSAHQVNNCIIASTVMESFT